ncbi:hypothetical protein AALB_2996 [Agarivorans albus MKT 106]|uniref:Uncharacterized protein n=1 Tax=Agarivorans albus MKT 106 TaxID=1331007 RepID=R9PTS2_AGAAL|nr:hypothetical protein AALB_2996 [Agarivorans albus MKT 106]
MLVGDFSKAHSNLSPFQITAKFFTINAIQMNKCNNKTLAALEAVVCV